MILLAFVLVLFLAIPVFGDVGDIGQWSDSAGSQLPTTSWADFSFGAEERNDGSHYTVTGDEFDLGEAGNYLALYYLRSRDASNGRVTWQGRVTLNGTEVEGLRCQSYGRNSANDEVGCRGGGLLLNVAATDDVGVEFRRDSDADTGGSVVNASELVLVRLPDDADAAYGYYTDGADVGAYSTQAWDNLTWDTVSRETDTATIERQAGNTAIRLKPADTRFFISYSVDFDGATARTQRITRATLNGTEVPGCGAYSYHRNSANSLGSNWAACLVETDGGGLDDLEIEAQRGTSDVAGGSLRVVDASGLFVWELPSSAETLIASDGTGGQDVSGIAEVTINGARTVSQSDATAFSSAATTDLTIEQDADVLLLGGWRTVQSPTTTARATVECGWERNAVDEPFGRDLHYIRGDQGTQDTFDGACLAPLVTAALDTEVFQFEARDLGDNGNGDDTVAGSVGVSAINLDTLEAAPPPNGRRIY